MKLTRMVSGSAGIVLALTLVLEGRAQENPSSAAIPLKELAPPPPKPTDGKHLITPQPPSGTHALDSSQFTNPLQVVKLWFEAYDKNADAKLSKDEWPARMRPGFGRADENEDGFVSLEERQAYVGLGKSTKKAPTSEPYGILTFRNVPYAGTKNPRQQLDLYLPKDPKSDKPLPLIVFVHGGGWRKGDKAAGANQVMRFVQSGHYATASIGYRLTDEAQWPAQIHDCKAAIRWLKAHSGEYFLDPTKIGVWGTSAGGHLVSMLGASGDVKELEGTLGQHLDQNSRVACVVNYFGPANFVSMIRQPSSIDRTTGQDYPEALLLGGAVPEREAVAQEASPVTHISAGDPPFFTAHGTKDLLVPFAQAEELHAALTKAGVPSILQQITNGGHGFRSTDLDQRVMRFFDVHLRGESSEIPSTPIVFPAPNP